MLAVLILVARRSAVFAFSRTLLNWGVGDVVKECLSRRMVALLLKVVEDVGTALHSSVAIPHPEEKRTHWKR